MCEAARIAFERKREEGYSLGKEQGYAFGWKQGYALGWKQGCAIGREQEKCAIALRMLKAQKSEAEILEFTELTREELAELRKRLG